MIRSINSYNNSVFCCGLTHCSAPTMRLGGNWCFHYRALTHTSTRVRRDSLMCPRNRAGASNESCSRNRVDSWDQGLSMAARGRSPRSAPRPISRFRRSRRAGCWANSALHRLVAGKRLQSDPQCHPTAVQRLPADAQIPGRGYSYSAFVVLIEPRTPAHNLAGTFSDPPRSVESLTGSG